MTAEPLRQPYRGQGERVYGPGTGEPTDQRHPVTGGGPDEPAEVQHRRQVRIGEPGGQRDRSSAVHQQGESIVGGA